MQPSSQEWRVHVCALMSCLHKADDEQQFGDAVQSEASGQVFWTLVSRLRGAGHVFDPLDHFLICRRGNGAEGLIQMLAAHVGKRPLLAPHCGVLHHFCLWRQLVGLQEYLLQFGQLQLWERKKRHLLHIYIYNTHALCWKHPHAFVLFLSIKQWLE